MLNKISILIPVYNEERTVELILNKIKEVKLINDIEKELIIVNDCSKDKTVQVIENYIRNNQDMDIQLFSHSKNQGKGAAINTAIKNASGDYIIIQDADLEYDPEDYNLMFEPVFKAGADVVYGSRFISSRPHRILFFWHSIGNKMLTSFSNMMTNLNLSDMETCYKLIRTSVIKKITIKENRFGIEPEITAKLGKMKELKIYEVGISYFGRTYDEGKKINWKDGFRALYCILKYKFTN